MRAIQVACLVAIVVAGCGSYTPASPVAPTAPSQIPPAVIGPSITSPVFPGFTLTQVRLSGVVFEVTAVGETPIGNVPVYCEPCGQLTHTWAYTNARGVYEFPSDPATGGGIWLSPGVVTQLRIAKEGYKDPPGVPPLHGPVTSGTGWREVLISGDTSFDVLLVRE